MVLQAVMEINIYVYIVDLCDRFCLYGFTNVTNFMCFLFSVLLVPFPNNAFLHKLSVISYRYIIMHAIVFFLVNI
jgi:hypothetical protein